MSLVDHVWEILRTADGYSGEQRLHSKMKRTGLAMPCDVKFVEIPVAQKVHAKGEPVMAIEAWPVLLPRDLLETLVVTGHLDLLVGTCADRAAYWGSMVRDFPGMQVDSSCVAPLGFYGDEATVFRESCMCLHWTPLLCPKRTDSLMSRFLLCVVPSSKYWIEAWLYMHLVWAFFM